MYFEKDPTINVRPTREFRKCLVTCYISYLSICIYIYTLERIRLLLLDRPESFVNALLHATCHVYHTYIYMYILVYM